MTRLPPINRFLKSSEWHKANSRRPKHPLPKSESHQAPSQNSTTHQLTSPSQHKPQADRISRHQTKEGILDQAAHHEEEALVRLSGRDGEESGKQGGTLGDVERRQERSEEGGGGEEMKKQRRSRASIRWNLSYISRMGRAHARAGLRVDGGFDDRR